MIIKTKDPITSTDKKQIAGDKQEQDVALSGHVCQRFFATIIDVGNVPSLSIIPVNSGELWRSLPSHPDATPPRLAF